MHTKKLIILASVAVVAIGLGIWLASERAAQTESSVNVLYPEFKQSVNEVSAIRIFTGGNERAVEIARKDSNWVISERNDYPADDAKVRKLLLNLANARVQEEKTSNPDNYATLGVEDVTAEDASSVRIEISGATPTVDLIVGKQGPGLESQYVRRSGEAKSWLIDKDLDTSSTVNDWLSKEVLDISADRIQSARIEASGAKPYSAIKNSKTDADFTVEGLPKGKKLSAPGAANTLATALASVTLSDVQPADTMKDSAADKAVYQTFDGLVVELHGWAIDDKRYVAFQSRFDQALADRFKVPSEPAAETPASDKPASDKEDAKDSKDAQKDAPANAAVDGAQHAKTLNDRATGWVFEIPEYKYETIFKPIGELLAD